jgi:hypothetical protein
MKKFKVIATRVDEYEIKIDKCIYGDPESEWKQAYIRYFNSEAHDLEDVVKDLSFMQLRFGSTGGMTEGFGYVCRNGELPFSGEDYDRTTGKLLPENERRQPAPGLNIKIISEDDDYEFDIEEITPQEGGQR